MYPKIFLLIKTYFLTKTCPPRELDGFVFSGYMPTKVCFIKFKGITSSFFV